MINFVVYNYTIMVNIFKDRFFWLVALVSFLSLFLFLGKSSFHTRGEPREALVAQAMINDSNWTLPTTNGVDMAYKPPFFHWMIAAASTAVGEVNEYTSRFPSAVALAAMVLVGYAFFAKRRGREVALLTALITLTNFEVHRAGVNCRVDMVLAAFMVLALYQLYKWAENRLRGIPWLGILFLSGAFLTKGPVGLVLPCAVVAAFCWIRGINFFRICLSFIGVALAACVLPAFWYVAAWKQGGEPFLQLVLEENVYRFLGKMSYSSHENPWPYNVMTVVTGFVPYTILLLISLFTLKYTRVAAKPKEWWGRFVQWIKDMDDARLFSLLSIAIMFVFYCIPKSKRSVYLLPIYPFIAYFIAEYIIWLINNRPKALRWFNNLMGGLLALLSFVFIVVRCGLVPHSVFGGKHAAENIAYLTSLETLPFGWEFLMALLPLAVAVAYFVLRNRECRCCAGIEWEKIRGGLQGMFMAFILFVALDGVFQPVVLNVKSNKPSAEKIAQLAPEGYVYSYITNTVMANRMHPFTLNFYLGNRIVPFVDFAPSSGYVIIGDKEAGKFMDTYSAEYDIEMVPGIEFKSNDFRDITHVYKFYRK